MLSWRGEIRNTCSLKCFPSCFHKFLDGSLDSLWREMQDPVDIFRDLTKPDELKGKKVYRAEEWREMHIEGEWRLYYRSCQDSKYQVLISHKNTQEADID
jgi:hypothetical protein